MQDVWYIFLVVGVLFSLLEIYLYIQRSRRLKTAYLYLREAKKEVEEVVKLPLSNPHPLLQISSAGEILFANPSALKAFPDVMERKTDHPVLKGLLQINVGNENGNTVTRELKYNNIDYHQTISVTANGSTNTIIVYCYDITDIKAIEEKLLKANKSAERARQSAEKANKARGDFLANMSHELRTPMNGIIGLSDILIEADLASDHKESIRAINSSSRTLLLLLNDILDFSKIEAGEITIENITFNFKEVIRQIEQLQSPVASSKGLNFKVVIDDNIPEWVVSDPTRVQQVINNLLSNALKFTRDGEVVISIDSTMKSAGECEINIRVSDTGIGIPAEKIDTVFAKFQQADVSTTRKFGGTGLGLSITKDLVHILGGEISLDSKEGKGTTFFVTFPMKIAEENKNEGRAAIQKQKNGKSNLNTDVAILIVDDHPVNILFMEKLLAKMGFSDVNHANSGAKAIELCRSRTFDLILMDCQMPDMDGFSTTGKLREIFQEDTETNIIAVTADATQGASAKCIAAGMNDYISKPIEKDKLISLLMKWLPGKQEGIKKTDIENKSIQKTEPVKNYETIIDWSVLEDYSEGDSEEKKVIVQIFLDVAIADLKRLKENISEKDVQNWDAIIHKVSGAASYVGARQFVNACEKAQEQKIWDEELMPELYKDIIFNFKLAYEELNTKVMCTNSDGVLKQSM